jgi:hypothetical protein
MRALSNWSKAKFGAITSELEQPRKKLEETSQQPQVSSSDEANKVRQGMDELLYRWEEMM